MDHHVTVIEQNPFGRCVTLSRIRRFANFFKLFLDFICNCLILAGISSATDQKMICKRGHIAQIEYADIACFL